MARHPFLGGPVSLHSVTPALCPEHGTRDGNKSHRGPAVCAQTIKYSKPRSRVSFREHENMSTCEFSQKLQSPQQCSAIYKQKTRDRGIIFLPIWLGSIPFGTKPLEQQSQNLAPKRNGALLVRRQICDAQFQQGDTHKSRVSTTRHSAHVLTPEFRWQRRRRTRNVSACCLRRCSC